MTINNKISEENQLTDSGYYILLALLEPKHGYGIMKYLEELTAGEFLIGPATLYTTLKKMQKKEFIMPVGEAEDRKKIYKLTEAGEKVILNEIQRRIRMAKQGEYVLNSMGRMINNE
ncbi:PadR family transcriptional regulator [Clostridium sp.]|uniref:PadR family transcriptional regulator n=1 Tax=Clostridium sp. TaxID=1506 RepID=UPI0032178135